MALSMQPIIIILLLLGIILILLSFVKHKTPVNISSNQKQQDVVEIIQSIENGKALIRNMNELYSTIMKEFDEKHKELLFIYDIINNKQKNLPVKVKEKDHIEEIEQSVDINEENINDKIIKLYKKGKTINEIAKSLNMGNGEVKLIIDLSKYKK